MMDWKRLNRGLLADEVRDGFAISSSGYKFKLSYFRTAMIVTALAGFLFFFAATLQGYGVSEVYLHCPLLDGQPCNNPFYEACDHPDCRSIESLETVPPGTTIGKNPAVVANYVIGLLSVIFTSFGLAFWINHVRYNHKFSFEVEL